MDDVYRHIVSFISSEERPVVSRAYLFSYVEQKWRRLNGIPLLVDIWWHSPWKCHKYCVCHVANNTDRHMYYIKRRNRYKILM